MVRRPLSLLGIAAAVLILGFVRAFWGQWKRQPLRHGRLPNDDNDHDHKISADLDNHRHLEGPRPARHQPTSGSCLRSRTQRGGNDPDTGGSSTVRRRTFLGSLDSCDRSRRNEFDWNDSGPSSRCRFAGPTGTGHPTQCLWLLKQTPLTGSSDTPFTWIDRIGMYRVGRADLPREREPPEVRER